MKFPTCLFVCVCVCVCVCLWPTYGASTASAIHFHLLFGMWCWVAIPVESMAGSAWAEAHRDGMMAAKHIYVSVMCLVVNQLQSALGGQLC